MKYLNRSNSPWARVSSPVFVFTFIVCALILAGLFFTGGARLYAQDNAKERIWLQDPKRMETTLDSPAIGAPTRVAQAFATSQVQPLTLANGRFYEEDGIEGLAVGYATTNGGAVALYRGNLDAFAPQSDESLFAIGEGRFPSPFLPNARLFELPQRPDFLVAGQFTGRDHTDVIAATKGSSALYLLANDGHGNFTVYPSFTLPGIVTALEAASFHSSAADTIIVGIDRPQGPALLVYETSSNGLFLKAAYPLQAPATALAVGNLDGDTIPDVAVVSGGNVSILHGRNLTAAGSVNEQLESVSLPFSATALALGDFVQDRSTRLQMALLASDGTLYIVARAGFDPNPWTLQELQDRKRGLINRHPDAWTLAQRVYSPESWKVIESLPAVASSSGNTSPVLFRTQITDHGTDDVMVLDPASQRMTVIAHSEHLEADGQFTPAQRLSRPYVGGSPVAAIPMRINVDARPGVMALHDGQLSPFVVMPIPDPTFFVNRTDDPVPGAIAGTCNNVSNADTSTSCSLREAVRKANATAGADTIQLIATTYQLTQARVAGDFTAAHGTLDITDSVTITGAVDGLGNPASIIEAGASAGTGVDKVFSFNQDISSFTNANVSITNLVIQFGHNRGAFGGLQDGFGGAFDYDTGGTVPGTGNANLVVTNCLITNNDTTDGDGGGAAIFNTNSGTGFAHFINSTIQNNSPHRATSGAAGGGIFVGSPSRIVLDNTKILNNTATQTSPATGNGGGIFTFGGPDPSVPSAIHASTISGNHAAGDGGGLDLDATMTIDTGSIVSNNQAGTAGGGPANGGNGGGIWFSAPTGDTLTISKTTITGNSSPGGSGATPGGGGIWFGANQQILQMHFSRLAGNTAPNGSNFDIPVVGVGSTLSATNNWWGTNIPANTITQGTPNSVTFDPFIVLTHTASPNKIRINQSTTLTADMSKDNHGSGVALSGNLDVITGVAPTPALPIVFNNAVDGSISGAQTTIQSNATATATFNAGNVAGGGKADAVVDQATVTANIVVLQPPSITKSFSPTVIKVGGTSTITFQITNPNVVTINASFTDDLTSGGTVSGLVVAATPSVSNGCGGSVTANAGATSISFLNAALPVSGSPCTITVNVTGTTDGIKPNSVTIDSTDAGNGNTATASPSLTVINPPTINKVFGASTIPLNGTTSVTFTITNPNSNAASVLNGISFTDTLPNGAPGTLVVANPNGLTNTCSTTPTAVAGSGAISLTGASLAAGASCTISVNVQGTVAGLAPNSVTVSDTVAGTGNTSSTSLTVVAPPTISKAFGAASIPLNGTTTMTFTVTNPNTTVALTGIAFSDTVPANLQMIGFGSAGDTCGGVTSPGASTVSYSALSVAANSSCFYTVTVKGIAAGTALNTTSAITSTEGGTGTTSNTATLSVVAPPTISKAFGATTIPLNGTTTVTFTITNPPANTVAETGIAFSDTLTNGLQVASTPGVTNSCGGTVTAAANSTSISLTGGSIATPGNTCTIVVNVTGTQAGVVTNTTGAVSSTNGGTGATSNTATLTVVAPATVTKTFAPTKIPLNGTTLLTINITNPNSTISLTGLSFTDSLPAGLVVASPANLNNTCGGTATGTAGSGSVSLSGGTIASSASCAVSLNVQGTTAGDKLNSVTVSSTEGGASAAATATVTVVAPPTISKAFNPTSIALNGTSTVTFTISNPNNPGTPTNGDLTGVAFSDTLPVSGGPGSATLVVSNTPNVSNTCGGTVTATAGSGVISLSGASVAHNTSCTLSVDVQGTVAGDANNTTGAISSTEGGTGTTSNTATLKVVGPPTISKAFGATNITLNGTTTVTFTITNPAGNTSAENGIAFSDTLTNGLQVASTPGVTNSCGGTVTAAANSTSISLVGGSIATPGATCTIVVNVTGTQSGTVTNTTGAVSSTNGGTGATSNTATLIVASPATVTKTFAPTKIPLNGTTLLTINITNPNSNVSLTGLSFTDSLPAGLVVASPANLNNTCGGTATATAGSGSVSLSGGTVASSASCAVSVNVQGTTAGDKLNSVTVSSTEGGASTPSTATVTVVAPPTISKAFNPTSIPLNGTSTVTFTISNPNNPGTPTNGDLTGVAFSDTLPVSGGPGSATLVVSNTPNVSNTCGGTVTATAGSGVISLSGGSVAHNTSCTLSVDVRGTVQGDANNTTGAISSTEGGTGATSNTATLKVVGPPTISKAFGAANITLNGTTTVTFTITNPAGNTSAENGIAFGDTLTNGLQVASTPGVTNSCGGTVTAAANSTSISLVGGSIATPGATCTIVVNVTGTQSGTVTNTTGAVSSTNGGTGATSNTATLIVASPPSITKSFNPTSIALNSTSTLSFSITNPNTNVALTGVAFTDNLPAGLVVAGTPSLSNSCGGTATATAGSGTVSLSAGTLATSASCTVSVNVQGATAGVKNNSVTVTSTEGGTGNTSNASVTVTPANTATVVISSLNPSVFGQSVTFTATVTNISAGSTGAPTGAVQFVVDGVNFGAPVALTGASATSSTATSAATATLSVAGSPHTVTANYINADGNFTNSSGSLSGGQTVTPAATATAVISSSNPSVAGQAVTFTATVTDISASSTAQPTGAVQFVVDGVNFGAPVTLTGASSNTSTATSAATATLTVAGSPHAVTANYVNADGNFTNSSSGVLGQVVTKPNTTITVTPSLGTITVGDTVTFTATVTVNAPGSGTPTGRVTFFDGSAPIASGTLNGSAQATFSTALLAAGSHSITAIYSGDVTFNGSPLSSPITETVNLRGTTTSVALNPTTVAAGQASTITVTVTDGGASTPPGTADAFSNTGAPATGRTGFTSTLFADGLVLVAGGTNASNAVINSAEIYSVTGAAFTATGNLNTARTGAVAVLLPNGKVLVAGGSSNGASNGALNSAELFDPSAGTFTPTSNNMTAARFGATATLLNTGKVLLAGGANGGGVLNSAELYDPAADTFTATGNLAAARTGASATLLGTGKVLVAGGSSNGTAGGALSSAELFDPAGNAGAGAFTSGGTLSAGRWQPEAALLLSGKVLIAGGQDAGGPLTTADLYNPGANSFTASTHQMSDARANGSAVAMPDGMVLLPGGTTSQAVDLYDEDNDKFNPTGSLLQFDNGLVSTLLNNGRVLVVGLTVSGPASDAELYSPSFNPLGTVGFSSSDATDVFGPACVLTPSTTTASTCTSTVTPAQVGTSPHTITGTYPADAVHSGSSNTASLTVIPTAPPTIAKAFSVTNVAQNTPVNVSFTIVNPNPAATLTGIAFTDALPAGLVVATPNNLFSDCGGTTTAVPGSSSISLTAGTVAPPPAPPEANGQCVITVDLLVTGTGTISNTTGPVSANQSGPGNPSNTATLNVVVAPTVNKAFGAASIPVNGTTSLTFNLANPNTAITLFNVTLSDTLPGGLVVATPNGLAGSCVASSAITAAAGSNSINLTALNLGATGSCSFSVNVTGTSGGTKNNTSAPITGLYDDGSGTFHVITGGTASASIVVVAPPVISKAFAPAVIPVNTNSTLTFTITNPNTTALTGVAFTDTFPAGLVISTPNGLTGTCGGGTITAVAGTGTISLTGATLPSGNCTFSVNVTSAAAGTYTNTTGPVSSTNGGTGNTATATLSVTASDFTISKSHAGNFFQGQTGVTYTITVSNIGTTPSAGTVTVTDTLPPSLTATAMSGTGWTCTVATLTCTRNDALANGATYPAITLTVNVSASAPASVTNTATVANTGDINPANNTANDPTTITAQSLTITPGTNAATVERGQTATFTFTVNASVPNAVALLCFSLPAGTTCSFNPAAPSSNGSTLETMTVTTTAPPPQAMNQPLTPLGGAPVYVAMMTLPMIGVLFASIGGEKRKKKEKILRLAVLAIILLAMVFALTGCGGKATGGGGNGNRNGGTPPGTYVIPITATNGQLSANTSVTLTVTP